MDEEGPLFLPCDPGLDLLLDLVLKWVVISRERAVQWGEPALMAPLLCRAVEALC